MMREEQVPHAVQAGIVRAVDLSLEYLKSHVPRGFWGEILLYESVESTNSLAMALHLPGTVVIADCQTRGRGRLGRDWISPPGLNISMSMTVKPRTGTEDAAILPLVGAVAAAMGLRETCSLPVVLKWPNDLMIGERKVGGVLTETRASAGQVDCAVVGVGINVNGGRSLFPKDLYPLVTTVQEETGAPHARDEIIVAILRSFERLFLPAAGTGGIHPVVSLWRELLSTIGKEVRVTTPLGTFDGLATDTDGTGKLLVRLASGRMEQVSAGDVIHLR